MNETLTLKKDIRRQLVESYVANFDIEEVGRLYLGETLGKDKAKACDSSIARMNGFEVLKDKKLQDEIDKEILEKRITPEGMKVKAYKMMHMEMDGRVRVEALKTLGKWLKLEDAPTFNMYNMSWQTIMEQAHNQKRVVEFKEKEIAQSTSLTGNEK
jgi:hypothetical protein